MKKSILRILKSGWTNFSRNSYLSVAATAIIALTLILFLGLITLRFLTSRITVALENKIDISAYFKTDAAEDQILQIKSDLMSQPSVESVEYVSKEQALEQFKSRHAGDKLIQDSLSQLDFNPLTVPTGIPAPYPTGISGDGSVIVGGPEDNGGSTVGSAVRWTNSGANVELLATPVGTVNSSAKAISTDGSAIVGWVAANSAPSQALLWTSGGFQVLTDLAGTTGGSKALGVSSTGSFVVGVGNLSNVDQAVRWRTR
ncbi:MAG: cell division transport system permease protein, partial [Parcubacteria group bacterium Licking1014_17]